MSLAAVWAGLEFRVPSGAISALPPFRAGSRQTGQSAAIAKLHKRQQPSRMYGMTPVQLPPTRAETDEWLAEEREALLASQHSHGSASKGKSGTHAYHVLQYSSLVEALQEYRCASVPFAQERKILKIEGFIVANGNMPKLLFICIIVGQGFDKADQTRIGQVRRVLTRSRQAGRLEWMPTPAGCCLGARAAAAARRAAAATCSRRLLCAACPARTGAPMGRPACASPHSNPRMLLAKNRRYSDTMTSQCLSLFLASISSSAVCERIRLLAFIGDVQCT